MATGFIDSGSAGLLDESLFTDKGEAEETGCVKDGLVPEGLNDETEFIISGTEAEGAIGVPDPNELNVGLGGPLSEVLLYGIWLFFWNNWDGEEEK